LPIHPLPQFEADLKEYLQEEEDRLAYEKLNAPSTVVVRFGYLKMVGEFPYTGESKPGCGSKLVVKTHRGTEIGEMLTSTCKNSGCSKSVTRKEMLEYIENSGGRQYPFYEQGRVLRIATVDDLNTQTRLEQRKNEIRMIAKRMVERDGLEMKIIEAEPIFDGERVVIYFGAEDRIDFRDLVADLSREVGAKVELRQIGARDEARITADYERCGQYCCCKNFLKVLKPVSMKSAKVQKATLDPLKISGRCGRLMCCLRYEDETYDQLRKNLPHRKSRVGTPEGDGIVINTQILTQLAMVRLDNNTDVAIPVEDLTEPEFKVAPEPGTRSGGACSGGTRSSGTRTSGKGGGSDRASGSRRASTRDKTGSKSEEQDARSSGGAGKKRRRSRSQGASVGTGAQGGAIKGGVETTDGAVESTQAGDRNLTGSPSSKKKRRRRKRSQGSGAGSNSGSEAPKSDQSSGSGNDSSSSGNRGESPNTGTAEGASGPTKKKRRRRRRRSGGEGGSGSGPSSGPSSDSGGGPD